MLDENYMRAVLLRLQGLPLKVSYFKPDNFLRFLLLKLDNFLQFFDIIRL